MTLGVFAAEIMYAIVSTRLLVKMEGSMELDTYFKTPSKTSNMLFPPHDVSYFLASYLMALPHRHLPRNTNLSTLINSLVDAIMTEDGLNLDGPERYQYILKLCQRGLNTAHKRGECGFADILRSDIMEMLFPSKTIFKDKHFDVLVLFARIYLDSPKIEVKLLFMVLELGYKKFTKLQKRDTTKVPFRGTIPLFGSFLEAAIRADNQDLVALFLKHDIGSIVKNVDQGRKTVQRRTGDYHWSYLHLAILVASTSTVERLLERTSLYKSRKGQLLRVAGSLDRHDVVDALIKSWYPLKRPEQCEYSELRDYHEEAFNALFPVLEDACERGNCAIVRLLLQYPYVKAETSFCPLEEDDKKHSTTPHVMQWKFGKTRAPITIAVRNGHVDVVRLLIQAGARPCGRHARIDGYGFQGSFPNYEEDHTMPSLDAAASRADLASLRILFEEGNLSADHRETWASALCAVNFARKSISPNCPSRDARDIQFWKYLVDGKHINLRRALEQTERLEHRHSYTGFLLELLKEEESTGACDIEA